MMTLECLCGGASVVIARLPDFVFECNCALCRKTGARWGYFSPEEVEGRGTTQVFRRTDKVDPASQIHFCPECGVAVHFTMTESAIARFGNSMAGVNMALADEGDLAGIELRFPDGRNWSGEGAFGFVRDPRVFGKG